ncbi:MAG: hypothetical protein JXR94_02380, partial [Candidatus Hydrogenedentes bacterium]|nr:hypothetical protein [Candidatus Hydrogenedentota bacterium]
SLDDDTFGEVLTRRDASAIGSVEGAEAVGGGLLLNAGDLHRTAMDLAPEGPAVALAFDGFGKHIAGVGETGRRGAVLVTVSGYRYAPPKQRNHISGFAELSPRLDRVRGFWHLGPFSNDPRGVSVSDGLVYIADGRAPFTDERTGEENRGGIKVLIFLTENNPKALLRALPLLPVRRLDTGS